MTQRSPPTIPPIIRSRSAKKKLPTSASPHSTSSTRRALLQRRMATSSSPAVAVAAAAVAVDAVVAADAAAAAVDAVAALAGVVAVSPGVRAVRGADRGHLPRVVDANNRGRVRRSRPGQRMSAPGVVRCCADTPRSCRILPSPNDIRAPIGLGASVIQQKFLHLPGGRRSRVPCADS
jgi:hypothetical protein